MQPSDAGFPKTLRLNNPSEFNRVFETATIRRRIGPLRVAAVENTMPTARLGLVVGKRAVRRAVDRNRVKRVLREEFRRSRERLPCLDIVIQVTGLGTNESLREAFAAIHLDLRTSG